MKNPHRNVVVLGSLFGALALTSVLLLALSPAPLSPDATRSLFALDNADLFDQVFRAPASFEPAQWKHVFIHHSGAPAGSGQQSEGDHFVIGNGNGCGDGEIQMTQRWLQQARATPAGARVNPACITICLVGDFEQGEPTAAQRQRLQQLVQAIQSRCGIAAVDVLPDNTPDTRAALGRLFPMAEFRQQLLR